MEFRMQTRQNLWSTFLLLVVFAGCNGQTNQSQICAENYKKAKASLNKYYINNNRSDLEESLESIETAIGCKEMRSASIDLKIPVLMLLEKYKSGYEFVDSLSQTDFNASYKKLMIASFFRALEYGQKRDTTNRNKLFNETIVYIQKYIQEDTSAGIADENAYYDLFMVKSRVLDISSINKEIDSLMNVYPNQKAFFDVLRNSLKENEQVAYPVYN